MVGFVEGGLEVDRVLLGNELVVDVVDAGDAGVELVLELDA